MNSKTLKQLTDKADRAKAQYEQITAEADERAARSVDARPATEYLAPADRATAARAEAAHTRRVALIDLNFAIGEVAGVIELEMDYARMAETAARFAARLKIAPKGTPLPAVIGELLAELRTPAEVAELYADAIGAGEDEAAWEIERQTPHALWGEELRLMVYNRRRDRKNDVALPYANPPKPGDVSADDLERALGAVQSAPPSVALAERMTRPAAPSLKAA